MPRLPTLKQRKFARAYVDNGGNASQAVIAAGYDTVTADRVIGSQNLTKANVRAEIERIIAQQRPANELIGVILKDAALATKDDQADHAIRLKAADLTARIVGAFDPDPDREPVKHLHLHLDKGLSRFIVLHGRYPTDQERKTLGLPAKDGPPE